MKNATKLKRRWGLWNAINISYEMFKLSKRKQVLVPSLLNRLLALIYETAEITEITVGQAWTKLPKNTRVAAVTVCRTCKLKPEFLKDVHGTRQSYKMFLCHPSPLSFCSYSTLPNGFFFVVENGDRETSWRRSIGISWIYWNYYSRVNSFLKNKIQMSIKLRKWVLKMHVL